MITHPPLPDLRFGIIGSASGIAASHLKALTQLPGASVAGMADVAIKRGEARAREVGCPFFADHRAMLETVRPDVAVICCNRRNGERSRDGLAGNRTCARLTGLQPERQITTWIFRRAR